MLGVAHLEGEAGGGDAVAGGLDGRGEDVDVLVGQDPGDVRQKAGAVQRLDLDGDQEDRRLGGRPLDVQDPLRLPGQRVDVDAVGAVHRDAVAAGDEADDGVARHRRTTAGQLDPHIVDALDDHTRIGAGTALGPRPDRGGLGDVLGGLVLPAERLHQLLDDALRGDMALADGGVEGGDVGVAHLVGEGDQGVARQDPLDGQVLLAHGAGDGVLALLDRLVASLLGEPAADLVAGARRFDEAEPVAGRSGARRLGGEDLHQVAVVQGRFERDEASVDPRSYRAVADLGVHRVGEVDGRGAGRQRYHIALRREDEDFVAREVEAQRFEELARVLGLLLPVEQLPQPGHVVDGVLALAGVLRHVRTDLGGAGDRLLLVLPVRGDAVLGAAVHVEGADLELDGLAAGADHRGVQRLVHVELRHRDVVLEPAGDRVPSRVDRAEGGVAVADRVDQDADAHQVVDLREVAAADDHLLVDAVVVLGAAGDGGLDTGGAQIGLDLVGHYRQILVPLGRPLGDQTHDLVVHLGVEDREGEVLQLPLDGVHAQAVGERGVDLQRLAGLLLLLLPLEVAHGAHVVQPVGELDDQDARVLGHRDDHLADGLGLRGLAELDPVELGDAVDQQRDLVAEVTAQLLQAVFGVLDGVVQQARHQRGRVHAQLGEDGGDRERVGDVRVAALALLAAVPALGDLVGPLDLAQRGGLDLGVVGADGAQQRFEDRVVRAGALYAQSGEAGADAVGCPGAARGGGRGRLGRRGGGVRSGRPGLGGRLGRGGAGTGSGRGGALLLRIRRTGRGTALAGPGRGGGRRVLGLRLVLARGGGSLRTQSGGERLGLVWQEHSSSGSGPRDHEQAGVPWYRPAAGCSCAAWFRT